jgi:hypothetical protein
VSARYTAIVAHGADGGPVGPGDGDGVVSQPTYGPDDAADIGLGPVVFHHDQHLSRVPVSEGGKPASVTFAPAGKLPVPAVNVKGPSPAPLRPPLPLTTTTPL